MGAEECHSHLMQQRLVGYALEVGAALERIKPNSWPTRSGRLVTFGKFASRPGR
jgi:hypothetical protein